ncbi:hypothetical protein E2C01_037819 [Portunus trituberculatus]|uniref:Uncharacterized protein n=1 Tax=Portunus trituberculatus TaxID=210409 RepID=A0A5B7FF21_PORTR|nr:hypothetical protein [Portunus trituberculatus]
MKLTPHEQSYEVKCNVGRGKEVVDDGKPDPQCELALSCLWAAQHHSLLIYTGLNPLPSCPPVRLRVILRPPLMHLLNKTYIHPVNYSDK